MNLDQRVTKLEKENIELEKRVAKLEKENAEQRDLIELAFKEIELLKNVVKGALANLTDVIAKKSAETVKSAIKFMTDVAKDSPDLM
jgi:predicted  nucleic acid-binding Zn-ribbon protein